MWLSDLVYSAYERRLKASLDAESIPRHVGVILDGNRRWAAVQGSSSAHGHRAGAEKIEDFLGWCEEARVEVVTLWLLSTDNLSPPAGRARRRSSRSSRRPCATSRPTLAGGCIPVGALDLLPARTSATLKKAEADTDAHDGLLVNVAVGYGGRREVVDAVRALLAEAAEAGVSIDDLAGLVDVEHIGEHLYTAGQPDPDLVIRTSGEQRLSGFLLWQSAHSEFYFCEAYWPDFRKVDFLRALRAYSERGRRFGA